MLAKVSGSKKKDSTYKHKKGDSFMYVLDSLVYYRYILKAALVLTWNRRQLGNGAAGPD